jgi:FtsP/CotA-like multicopper oxidase with cupredoxin domain
MSFQGIRQNQTMHMDGVNGVTQCPIAPGDHFVYNFTAAQYGSSWYHSHYSVQYADGAVGPLTLHGPTSTEWDEAISPPLIMTDWGHNTAFVAVSNPKIGLENPDILLNGRGNVTNYNNATKATTEIQAPYNITFEGPKKGRPDKRYLMRIINTSFETTFVFSIDNHMLEVVSADFAPIQPYKNQSILVGIGQRYNVIVEAKPLDIEETGPPAADGNYWIRTQVAPCFRGASRKRTEGYERTGILRYNPLSTAYPTTEAWKKVPTTCRDEDFEKLNPILCWNVKRPPINGGDSGESFDVASGIGPSYYPLAGWSLGAKENSFPLRVNYSDPTFFHLDRNATTNPWPDMWNIVSENYTDKDWVS